MSDDPSHILITGGTGKIGAVLVRHFCREGLPVCFTSTGAEKALLLQKEMHEETGFKPPAFLADFTLAGAAEKLSEEISRAGLPISQIIHNARSMKFLKMDERHHVSEDDFLAEFRVGVVFPYRLSVLLAGAGHPLRQILFISSMYGVVAPTPALYENFAEQSCVHYGVTKAAQIHLTKELAVRLAERKIRVNCVSFGGLEGRTSVDFQRKYAALNPLQGMLSEQDIVPPVHFLIRHPESKMTGHNLIVDGGWSIW